MQIIKNNPSVCGDRETFGVIDAKDIQIAWGCTVSRRFVFSPVGGLSGFAGQTGINVGGEVTEEDSKLRAAIAAAIPYGREAAFVGGSADRSVRFLAELGGTRNPAGKYPTLNEESAAKWCGEFLRDEITAKAIFAVIFGVETAWLENCYAMDLNPLPALRKRGAVVRLDKTSYQFHDTVVVDYFGLSFSVSLGRYCGANAE